MEKNKAERFERAVANHAIGFQQDVFSYIIFIERLGFTVQDIKEFHEYSTQKRKKEQKSLDKMDEKGITKPCSECPAVMFLYDVNFSPNSQTGDEKDKTVWICQNEECMETIYNKETVEEIIKSGGT